MVRKFFSVVLIAMMFVQLTRAQHFSSADSAFALAGRENKNVLLVFTGPDWCAPCIRFEKKVLEDTAFIGYAEDHLVLMKADFPQTRKQMPQVVEENERLAEKYNPSGSFPLIVLLKPDREVVAYLDYRNEDVNEYISMISRYLP